MAAVPITISGVLCDKYGRTIQPVTIVGEATLTGLGVGGGPIVPPGQPGGPDHIWGPTDPFPTPPIANVPGAPGYRPPGDHIWGPTDPRPTPPIANVPGLPPMPDEPPAGSADEDGFIKPPPDGGGWAYHEDYGWMYSPGASAGQPHSG
jgi:hypothetical protein